MPFQVQKMDLIRKLAHPSHPTGFPPIVEKSQILLQTTSNILKTFASHQNYAFQNYALQNLNILAKC
jgi:hypothetical protein